VERRTFLSAIGAVGMLGAVQLPPGATPVLENFVIDGSDAVVPLRPGPGATLLLHVARRFHYEVEALRPGDATSAGGGTVLILAPARLPAGLRGGLFPAQEATVRDILTGCDGQVRWGGDRRVRPQEGVFALAGHVRRGVRVPDVFSPSH
jgi:hypothetical protein